MKMRSWQSGRRRGGLIDSPGGLIAAFLVLLTVVVFIMRLAAPSVLYALVRPLWSVGANLTAAVGQSSGVVKSGAELTKERDALAAENAALMIQNATLTARAHDLEVLLGTRTAPQREIAAGVLAGPPVSAYDVLVLDQGTTAGVVEGAHVYGTGGTPIGRITSVSDRSSRVTLYSAPGRMTEGWLGQERVSVTLKGLGAGAFEASVPREAGVAVGQGVYVPGPGALPIGEVVKVDSDPSSPTVTVHIRPYINPFSITWVTIQSGYAL